MRHLIFHNLGLKIFSVALAVLLWLVIRMYLERETKPPSGPGLVPATLKYSCPVQVLHSSTNTQIYQVAPAEVTVKVSGDAALLRRLRTEDIQVFLKLLDLAQPRGAFVPEVNLPPGVRLVEVDPPQVSVSLVSPK